MGSRPWAEIPAYTDAGDVFAMPCRTRLGGLEPEAYGIVFLEAAACGLPVVVGASGGAPETVMDGESGYVVDPTDDDAVCSALVDLLKKVRQAEGVRRVFIASGVRYDLAERSPAFIRELATHHTGG